MSIRVLIVDDHEIVRYGLRTLFMETPIEIVGEATTSDEAMNQLEATHPDVILLDVRMEDGSGLEVLEKIVATNPQARVVMLSTHDNPTYVARSVALGATDYVLKGSPRQLLLDSIGRAAAGEGPSESSPLTRVRAAMKKRRKAGDDEDIPLTNRELQVLRHVALGLSNREIGRSLSISIETVKEHVQNILRKLTVTDRTQAAVWAVKRSLV